MTRPSLHRVTDATMTATVYMLAICLVRARAGTARAGGADMIGTDLKQAHPLRLAMLAADEVRQHLREYADATHLPAWEAVQAADLLDTVADLLGKAVTP